MPSRPYLYLDTPRGRLHLYPGSVTHIEASQHAEYDLVVYHGQYNAANLYLTHEEAAGFISRMWGPHECRLRPCYGRREAVTVPAGCVGCLLRKALYEAGFNDLRQPLQRPVSPWPTSIAIVGGLFGFMWLVMQTQKVEAVRHEQEVRQLRAEVVRLRATFKRQSQKP